MTDTVERPSDDMPAPPEAFGVEAWDWCEKDGWCRMFTLREWHIFRTRPWPDVAVDGTEYLDGRPQLAIYAESKNDMTADDARALANALIEAADHLQDYQAKHRTGDRHD